MPDSASSIGALLFDSITSDTSGKRSDVATAAISLVPGSSLRMAAHVRAWATTWLRHSPSTLGSLAHSSAALQQLQHELIVPVAPLSAQRRRQSLLARMLPSWLAGNTLAQDLEGVNTIPVRCAEVLK